MRLPGILTRPDAERICDTIGLWGPSREAFLLSRVDGRLAGEIAAALEVDEETVEALLNGAQAEFEGHDWGFQEDRDLIEGFRNRRRCDPTASVVELRSPIVNVSDLHAPLDTLQEMLARMTAGGEHREWRDRCEISNRPKKKS